MALARIFSNYITKILRVFKNRDSILMASFVEYIFDRLCVALYINLLYFTVL